MSQVPLTTASGLQIGRAWRPVEIPRELTYEELWTQRLLLGEPVGGRGGRIHWPVVASLVVCMWIVLAAMAGRGT